MARKFKIGDKVRVKGCKTKDAFSPRFRVKSEGTIVEYDDVNCGYPYGVRNKNSAKIGWFAAKELELIN